MELFFFPLQRPTENTVKHSKLSSKIKSQIFSTVKKYQVCQEALKCSLKCTEGFK